MKNYKILIGYSIDTNQVKSAGFIKTEQQAKKLIEEIIQIYGEEMFEKMYLFDKRFSSYTAGFNLKGKLKLSDFLNL